MKFQSRAYATCSMDDDHALQIYSYDYSFIVNIISSGLKGIPTFVSNKVIDLNLEK